MQSKDTKNLNLDNLKKTLSVRFSISDGTSRPRLRDSGDKRVSSRWSRVLKCKMEGVMTLVAERFFHEEMKGLQGVCMLTSDWAREW